MDFCNNTTYPIIESINFEGVESQEYLYKVLVPILLAGCVLSLLLNSVLVAVGTMSRKSIRTRSPILVLSLNLAATDGIASLLMGLGLLINSYLPVVFGINLAGDHGNCSMLIFEILRLSSLIASAMHLLALALVHYKGIVNPLHYRSVIFCSQHRTRSIYLMSFICWFMPSIVFAFYFISIPCQGFRNSSCRTEFILTLRFRLIVVVSFFIPLILMFVLYIRIFVIIKQHQAQRALHRQQSCQVSIRSHTGSLVHAHSSLRSHSQHTPLMIARIPKTHLANNGNEPNGCTKFNQNHINGSKKLNQDAIETKATKLDPNVTNGATENHQVNHESGVIEGNESNLSTSLPSATSLMMVTNGKNSPRTIIYRQHGSSQSKMHILMRRLIHCPLCIRLFDRQQVPSDQDYSQQNKSVTEKSLDSVGKTSDRMAITSTPSLSLDQNSSNCSTGHTKALVTTLLILGTYILCWMPAVIFFALTCVDYCPFPITQMNFRQRILISFIANGLVILKAIIDPFIYTYRMKEMKTALNRCFSYICPAACVTHLCPSSELEGSEWMRRTNTVSSQHGTSSIASRHTSLSFRNSHLTNVSLRATSSDSTGTQLVTRQPLLGSTRSEPKNRKLRSN